MAINGRLKKMYVHALKTYISLKNQALLKDSFKYWVTKSYIWELTHERRLKVSPPTKFYNK